MGRIHSDGMACSVMTDIVRGAGLTQQAGAVAMYVGTLAGILEGINVNNGQMLGFSASVTPFNPDMAWWQRHIHPARHVICHIKEYRDVHDVPRCREMFRLVVHDDQTVREAAAVRVHRYTMTKQSGRQPLCG